MGDKISSSCAPVIWPDPAVPSVSWESSVPAPWASNLFGIDRVFGVTYDLCDSGIHWLAGLLGKQGFRCRLILLLYPACATREEHLNHILDWQNSFNNRFQMRLLPVNTEPMTVLSLLGESGPKETTMAVGAVPNLGIGMAHPGIVNFLFHPDRVLHEAWCGWFDRLWEVSVPLTATSAAVPALVPAQGSPEASRMWSDYVQACHGLARDGRKDVSVKAQAKPSVTAELGVPRLDPLSAKIAVLYQKGRLVSVDKSSRIPPLEIPIKPEWFGIDSFRRVGSVSRRLSYRVSSFSEEELRGIENKRKAAQSLLQRFSFSLADGQWWIPRDAERLFEEELERVNSEGVKQLREIVGEDVGKFIESREERILKDAEDMYRETHPGGSLPVRAAKEILVALNDRLGKIDGARLLPQVTYAEVQFSPEKDSKWTTPWAQALRLLSGIAEFPRKALTDPFFFHGLRVKEYDLVKAMDVCNDACVSRWTEGGESLWNLGKRVRDELNLLQQIMQREAPPRAKCAAILALIAGGGAGSLECLNRNTD